VNRRLRHAFTLSVVISLAALLARAQSAPPSSEPQVSYTLSLAGATEHRVRVSIKLPSSSSSEADLQLPVWNALYQVRDFSQYVNWVRARNASGESLTVRNVDKSRWRVSGAGAGTEIQYEIVADLPGPYNAQLNGHHAFFNLAEILMYPVNLRNAAMHVEMTDAPPTWKVATALDASRTTSPTGWQWTAPNYDRLVDSPVEAGEFEEQDFDQGGGHYRVVVDADRADYDLPKIVAMVRRIVAAETDWMNDRPFDSYLFIYHFPRESSFGGMEHAYSTAIDLNAQILSDTPRQLADVTAHEFFHLWNVKRIRPQSLEPVDYTKENYTDALWFSEGVTSAVQNYALLRAGLIDDTQYLNRLAGQIGTLETRPAHLTQSAEESSLDAWLEKYTYYRQPERSISYYNKGELLGVMLDLALRDASNDSATLRKLFQWLNQNYAQQSRYFADSEGIRQIAETVGHTDLSGFFRKYVAGREEIPWDQVFHGVGLRMVRSQVSVADSGFAASQRFDSLLSVYQVEPGSEAERAGLAIGDAILQVNGHVAGRNLQQQIADMRPGDTLRLRVRNSRGEHEMHWKLGSHEEVEFELKDVDNITPQQMARRAAWLHGD
jgi:predicted metalloprotease with PDZ domain